MKNTRTIIAISIIALFACSCVHNSKTSIVNNYIDSIIRVNTKKTHWGESEIFWLDEYHFGKRRQQWVFTDTIEKYADKEKLIMLYRNHESPIIRMVAFHILLKNSPQVAVGLAIEDINDTDSLLAGRCDEALEEAVSSMRIGMIMQWPSKYNISIEDSLSVDSAVRKSSNRENIWYFQHNCNKN